MASRSTSGTSHDVDRAFEESRSYQASDVFWWTSGAQSAQILIDGDVAAGMAWNGRCTTRSKAVRRSISILTRLCSFRTRWWYRAARRTSRNRWGIHRFFHGTAAAGQFLQADPAWAEPNEKALPLLDKARLAVLPSSRGESGHVEVFQNFDWWAENGSKTGEKFNSWLLS